MSIAGTNIRRNPAFKCVCGGKRVPASSAANFSITTIARNCILPLIRVKRKIHVTRFFSANDRAVDRKEEFRLHDTHAQRSSTNSDSNTLLELIVDVKSKLTLNYNYNIHNTDYINNTTAMDLISAEKKNDTDKNGNETTLAIPTPRNESTLGNNASIHRCTECIKYMFRSRRFCYLRPQIHATSQIINEVTTKQKKLVFVVCTLSLGWGVGSRR